MLVFTMMMMAMMTQKSESKNKTKSGSVHDTGGMVEWAGTVGRDGGSVVALSSSFFILSPCFCLLFYFPLQWLSNDHPNISAWAVPACGGKQLGGV